jgi:hypothetical protein
MVFLLVMSRQPRLPKCPSRKRIQEIPEGGREVHPREKPIPPGERFFPRMGDLKFND